MDYTTPDFRVDYESCVGLCCQGFGRRNGSLLRLLMLATGSLLIPFDEADVGFNRVSGVLAQVGQHLFWTVSVWQAMACLLG